MRRVGPSEQPGKALPIVNLANGCGCTPRYAGLEEPHRACGPRGLVVPGLPRHRSGGQEPGTRAIKWNFTTFLVGPAGRAVRRDAPPVPPWQMAADIEAVLPASR